MKKEKAIKILTLMLFFGIALLNFGVFLVGTHIPHGNIVLVVASAIVYISIIILALKS